MTTRFDATARPAAVPAVGGVDMSRLVDRLQDHPGSRMRFLALDGNLVEKTFAEVHADVEALVAELSKGGLRPGDFVGILGVNCYEWVVADLAVLALGCVSVALPVERGGAVDPGHLVDRYHLSALLLTHPLSGDAEPSGEVAVLSRRPVELTARTPEDADPPAVPAGAFTIAFSSGTSGTRKGLMLSRAGVANTIAVSGAAWGVTADDDILVVMPFSNFQQRYLVYTAIWFGADATVVAPERMFLQLKSLSPTIVLGPPSFYEIVLTRVGAADRRGRRRHRLAAVLHAVLPRRSARARARLGRPWTAMYGDRIRLMLTGSAPVPPRVVTLFQQLGLPLMEVYGSTEVGWIALNTPRAHRIGVAGRPAPGVGVTIADDGEVLVRTAAPQALGYLFDGEETHDSVFRPDGTIATGDVAEFDRAGFLRLTGRKKNVIVTRSGVKINPEPLEKDLEQGCRATRAMVFPAEGSGLLAAVVWLDDDSPDRREVAGAYLDQANRSAEPAHRITRLIFRPAAELTAEAGLLTRNLKLDRTAVLRTVRTEQIREGS